MENQNKSQIQLETVDPEIRSYIYQILMDLQPFTTPDTTVSVVAKETEPQWRISITLSEDGTKIEEEALHDDIYIALRMAKDNLVKTLSEIQNEAISNQERFLQIRSATEGSQLH